MTEHERAQEALAARALRALDITELEAVDELIAAHLPACPACTAAARDFEVVAAELALGAPPRDPLKRLATRIHRQVTPPRTRARVPTTIVAAAVVGLVGLSAWTLHLTGRVTRAERQQANTAELISAVSFPHAKVVPLAPSGPAAQAPQVAAVVVPGRSRLYVFGSMPEPQPERVYQLWLGSGESYASGGTFVPGNEGFVLLRVEGNPAGYDHILITEEPRSGSVRPSAERVAESEL
jgi:hypothetical protein